MDGLEIYGSEYLHIRFQSALLDKVERLETKAQTLARSELSRSEFAEKHALLVGRFMLGVQNILAATTLEKNDFVPWTSRLSNQDFANLIWEFYQVTSETDKIQILAQCLEHWGMRQPYFSPAALRSVTTLARLLDPQHWGAMCWRVLACLGFRSMTELKQARLHTSPSLVQCEFAALTASDIVHAATSLRLLTCDGLPDSASVAAALYCISLDLWPTEVNFERPDPLGYLPFTVCQAFPATV
jgi:hypothetical protein